MQFYWDGIYTVGWPSSWYSGCSSGVPGNKTPSRLIVLAQAVSSLPVEPYDAVHSLKNPHEIGQVYQAAGSQGLILSSLQILNSCNEYFNIKLMLCQSMNLI